MQFCLCVSALFICQHVDDYKSCVCVCVRESEGERGRAEANVCEYEYACLHVYLCERWQLLSPSGADSS